MPVNATLYGKKLLNRYSARERKNRSQVAA
jgi:hypothetical protein